MAHTPNCNKVWGEIGRLKIQGVNTEALEKALCDFEGGFIEHVKEYHSEESEFEGLIWMEEK